MVGKIVGKIVGNIVGEEQNGKDASYPVFITGVSIGKYSFVGGLRLRCQGW